MTNPTSTGRPTGPAQQLHTQVCVVGGGPGGLALGLELARQGVRVVVLEQSGSVNRSFRGESVSPDAVWLLRESGVLDQLPDPRLLEVHRMEVRDGGDRVLCLDYADFDYPQRYPVELPQPMLLTALTAAAERWPGFQLMRQCTVTDVVEEGGRFCGVVAHTPAGELQVRADVVVAADGRYSKMRELCGVPFTKLPLQRDFLWFKTPCPEGWDHRQYSVRLDGDQHVMVIPTYPDLLRVGFNIPKDGLRQLRHNGIEALHERMRQLTPDLADTIEQHVTSWRQTSMLEIFTTVVPTWHRGRVLLIGDAAHTLSPVLGQGVNHAIIDAIVLAPMLAEAVACGADDVELGRVFRRFQRVREPQVVRARRLQLRQERAFAASGRVRVAVRKRIYRMIDRNRQVKRRLWRGIFYGQQHASRAVPANAAAQAPAVPEVS